MSRWIPNTLIAAVSVAVLGVALHNPTPRPVIYMPGCGSAQEAEAYEAVKPFILQRVWQARQFPERPRESLYLGRCQFRVNGWVRDAQGGVTDWEVVINHKPDTGRWHSPLILVRRPVAEWSRQ